MAFSSRLPLCFIGSSGAEDKKLWTCFAGCLFKQAIVDVFQWKSVSYSFDKIKVKKHYFWSEESFRFFVSIVVKKTFKLKLQYRCRNS